MPGHLHHNHFHEENCHLLMTKIQCLTLQLLDMYLEWATFHTEERFYSQNSEFFKSRDCA